MNIVCAGEPAGQGCAGGRLPRGAAIASALWSSGVRAIDAPVPTRGRPLWGRAQAAVAAAGITVGVTVAGANAAPASINGLAVPATSSPSSWVYSPRTRTPIKHLVVIFDENESFDHYFGTYPYAANTDVTTFTAKPGTPTVNGLYTKITKSGPVGPLLTNNPNEYNPQRLTSSEALTSDQNHDYTPEQDAVDNGKLDKFVQETDWIHPYRDVVENAVKTAE